MIRSKALRKLIEIAEKNPQSVKEIQQTFKVSRATAYDYWNTIKKLREIFSREESEDG